MQCLQASEGRALTDAAHGAAATALPGTQLCCTRQAKDLLHCMGGAAVLLHLFGQLDLQVQGAGADGRTDPGRAPALVRLVAGMLRGSTTNIQATLQCHGAPTGGWDAGADRT